MEMSNEPTMEQFHSWAKDFSKKNFIVSVLLSFTTARKEEQTKNHTMEHDIYHNSGGFIFDECVAEKKRDSVEQT